ncbi:MAG: 2-oxo acid dehydrogenase subunit E2 [Limnochordaceae bacterium]|nr:2-oxo acid dehydrogenase subunit E2 [Limnochordaceae bacterium]
MRWQLRLPDLGEGIHEAELVAWLVSPGDNVAEDQTVVQVETDKSIAEIPSPLAGRVVACHGQEGDRLAVGDPLLVLDVESVPAALAAGILPDGPADAGQLVATSAAASPTATSEAAEASTSAAETMPIQALPAVRKLSRELGVDLATVSGTGPHGRITEEDVRRQAAIALAQSAVPRTSAQAQSSAQLTLTPAPSSTQQTSVPAVAAVPQTPPAAAADHPAAEERIALRGIRRQIALNMARSFYTAPHAAVMDELEASELVQLRRLLLPQAQAAGVHLTYLPFIVMAVVKALQAHPYLNASLDDEHQEIVLKKEYNIGIATDTPDGLLVPVIQHADRLPLFALAREISRLVELARNRQLAPSDTHNGTFTITNIGPLGGLWSVPIIRHPEVAILAVHRIQPRPIVEDDRIVVGQMLNLVLTFDHRVVDGADALRFLKDLIHNIQHPALLFLDPGK